MTLLPGGSRLHFCDRLAALVEERRSQVVLGLDPDPAALWPAAVGDRRHAAAAGPAGPGPPRPSRTTARRDRGGRRGVRRRSSRSSPASSGSARRAGRRSSRRSPTARDHGLLVIADGKRGDVPVTARAYAQALVGSTPTPFGPVPGPGRRRVHRQPAARPRRARAADRGRRRGGRRLLRARPHLEPRRRRAAGRAAARRCTSGSRGSSTSSGAAHTGDCGLSLVGAVTGATRPELLARLRELMPRAIFLLPGVGAQGGRVEDLGAAFEPHPAAGLITASRSIVNAHAERGGDPAAAAAAAAEELRASAERPGRPLSRRVSARPRPSGAPAGGV